MRFALSAHPHCHREAQGVKRANWKTSVSGLPIPLAVCHGKCEADLPRQRRSLQERRARETKPSTSLDWLTIQLLSDTSVLEDERGTGDGRKRGVALSSIRLFRR